MPPLQAAIPFDFYELVAALAPRAFFSNSPYTDPNFNVSGVWAALYALVGSHGTTLTGPRVV